MSETIDPITWLKEFVGNRRRIELNKETNELDFENSSIRLPLNAKTAWKRSSKEDHYTLGSLWMYLHMKDAKMSDYSREANKLNIAIVDFKDKKEIVDYFTGVLGESSQIDTAIRAQTLIKKSDIRLGKVIQA